MKNSFWYRSLFSAAIILSGFGVFAAPALAQSYGWYAPQWYSPPSYNYDSYSNYKPYGSGYNYNQNSYQDPYQNYNYNWNWYQPYQNWNQPKPQPQPQPTYGGQLSINGVDGPSQLQVGQQGMWSVRVSDSSGYLSYSVIWGDEQANPYMQSAASAQPVSSSGTFTHAYQQAGTYTPRFTVTNSSGQSQSASATVTVSGGGGCTGSNCSANFTASPTSGAAPLAVTFSGAVPGAYFGGVRIDYGDGSALGAVCNPGGGCSYNILNHTYTQAGTYSARLVGIGEGGSGGVPGGTLGTVTITVTGGNQCGYPYPWMCYSWQERLFSEPSE